MDYSLRNHLSFIGSPVADLPTPALVISKPVLEANIAQLHQDVEAMGIAFRPHVKTLKSVEVTRMMLGGGKHRKIVASTVADIEGLLPLVEEGILDEALYGVPVAPSKIPRLAALRHSLRIVLMIDHDQQIAHLEAFSATAGGQSKTRDPWDVLIKIDVGTRRAGIPPSSPRLADLVRRAETSTAVNVLGFYAHAGHSYSSRSQDAAQAALSTEAEGVLQAAGLLPADRAVLVSIGSTPTAHVVRSLQVAAPRNVALELHAGNFPAHDLQQVSTGLVRPAQQALRLCVEVCSLYPERNEALVNAGTIAISKETSSWAGYGNVVGKPGWYVQRTSQEHGILAFRPPSGSPTKGTEVEGGVLSGVDEVFKVGDKVLLHVAHACITASNHHVYYVVDEDDMVRETWIPWKGW
ncbi:hypothetical protein SODALDRAFT_97330 [Sodiomyces alkalinus F11]|uniref:D-serine dehydratase n=1 Tax=Sodiomyces alkalinus (strain CBS 110278 / VKM F-3762 / F11) TaxID=1314773 RepID=A0A3N2Q158_SODAK|nr:hypothetical protein SODALDRAFT_97330 [Sodiomyces alkalinus F11]ROT40491.1 hypothetical protein SODALDRAFT_97330 [Sodiomyces alkalinus F11]